MADVFDALAHPARRALLAELRDGPQRAGDLGADLDMTREAVSKHLRVLRETGVVTSERRGRESWCTLRPEALTEVDSFLTPYRIFWTGRLDALATEVARGQRARRLGASSDPHRDSA